MRYLILMLLTTQLYAATTGSLLLKGNMPAILELTVTPETAATNLDLTTDQTDVKVATVQERSNSSTGYTVTIDSANLGDLVRVEGTETVPYTMKYDGSAVDLSSTHTINNPSAAAVAVNKDVSVSYSAQTVVAGDYEDTITFSIQSN